MVDRGGSSHHGHTRRQKRTAGTTTRVDLVAAPKANSCGGTKMACEIVPLYPNELTPAAARRGIGEMAVRTTADAAGSPDLPAAARRKSATKPLSTLWRRKEAVRSCVCAAKD